MSHNKAKPVIGAIEVLAVLLLPMTLIWAAKVPRGQRIMCWPASFLVVAFCVVWAFQYLGK